jgi:integrase
MARSITNRLSDRRVRTAGVGKHLDGGGLILRVTEGTGGVLHRYWVFRYADRGDGRDRQLGLGPLHTVSLAQAREEARGCRELLRQGKDPIATRRSEEASQVLSGVKAMTFSECADAYIAAHRAGWSNVKHAQQWENSLATYVTPVIGSLPVAAIDTGLVLKVLEPHWTEKTETMSRVRGRIESVLGWAKVRGYRTGENPGMWRGHLDHLLPAKTKMQKGKTKHQPALPYTRIGEFLADLRTRPGTAARALEFAILCASRTEEVIAARWSEIDLGAAVWSIPAERMKGRQLHTVPLSEPALAILRSLQHRGGADEYVFAGRKPGKSLGTMAFLDVMWAMNAARQAAGLQAYVDPQQGSREIVPHGFRSSFRDWAAERTNFQKELAEKALAHTIGDETVRSYQRGELLEKRRRLMTAWSAFCAKAPAATGVVVPLRKDIPA